MSDLQNTIDEFTRQAAGFAEAPQIQDEEALRLVCTLTNAASNDTVLDVACGPGILTCALAQRVRHLLEQRTLIFQELRRLREDGELRRSLDRLEKFIGSSRFLDEEVSGTGR